jgi:hypothetical protein
MCWCSADEVRAMIRNRLTYANVIATLALFIALGGTGYAALSLPRDSVGARQIRTRAVGHSELGRNAVRSDNVADASLEAADLSSDARSALRGLAGPRGQDGASGIAGPQGPKGDPGVPGSSATSLWTQVSPFGQQEFGTARSVSQTGTGVFVVTFARPVSQCGYSATMAKVAAGDPFPGMIDVADSDGAVRVRTYDHNGVADDIGFHLIVVC